MKKIIAVEDKVVVKILEQSNMTESGLFIPETAQGQQPQLYGTVVSCGPDVNQIEIGNTVMFHRQGGMDIVVDKVIYKVLGISELYAIIEES